MAEIVEHKLVFDGDFDTYRFTIKFQSNQGSEYALTFDPQTELYRAGIHGPNRSVILKILLVLVRSGPRFWKFFGSWSGPRLWNFFRSWSELVLGPHCSDRDQPVLVRGSLLVIWWFVTTQFLNFESEYFNHQEQAIKNLKKTFFCISWN